MANFQHSSSTPSKHWYKNSLYNTNAVFHLSCSLTWTLKTANLSASGRHKTLSAIHHERYFLLQTNWRLTNIILSHYVNEDSMKLQEKM